MATNWNAQNVTVLWRKLSIVSEDISADWCGPRDDGPRGDCHGIEKNTDGADAHGPALLLASLA